MKTKNAILAKVLAFAIVLTSVLPNSLLAQAAMIETAAGSANQAEESLTPLTAREADLVNEGGEATWYLASYAPSSKDGNISKDLTTDDAPPVVYSKDLNISPIDPAGVNPLEFSYDMYVNGTGDSMRFGIFLQYIDNANYFYLEKTNDSSNLPGSDGLGEMSPKWHYQWHTSADGDAERFSSTLDTFGVKLQNFQIQNVRIKYIAADAVEVTIKKIGTIDYKIEGGKRVGSGKITKIENGTSTTITLADKDYTAKGNETNLVKMTSNVFASLNAYEASKPRHIAFKAGIRGNDATKIDISNMKSNCNSRSNAVLQPLTFEQCGWEWVKKSTYATLDADKQPIMKKDNVVGGRDFVALSITKESPDKEKLTSTLSGVTNFEYGTVSAILRPVTPLSPQELDDEDNAAADSQTEGQEAYDKEFYLQARYKGEDQGVAVGWDGTQWVGKVNGTEVFTAQTPVVKMHDTYKVEMAIDHKDRLTASIAPVAANGDVGTKKVLAAKSQAISVSEASAGGIAVTAEGYGSRLYVRELNYAQKTYADLPNDLSAKYAEAAADTKFGNGDWNKDYYQNDWNAFKDVMNRIADDEMTLSSPDAEKIALQTAWDTLKDNKVKENQKFKDFEAVYEGKGAYQNNPKGPAKDITEQGDYLEASWNAFKAEREKADAFMATEWPNGFDTAADLEEKLDAINLKSTYDALAKKASEAEKASLRAAITTAEGFFAAEQKKYYEEADWNAYQTALTNAKNLLTAASISDKDIEEKLNALNRSKGLSPRAATATEKASFQTEVGAVEAGVTGKKTETDAYKAALAAAKALFSGAPTLKALDGALAALKAEEAKLAAIPAKKEEPAFKPGDIVTSTDAPDMKFEFVAPGEARLKEYTGSSSKVEIPATMNVNGVELKIVEIPANVFTAKNAAKMTQITIGANVETISANAFNGCKNLKTVIVGANVKSIAKAAFNNCGKIQTITFKGKKLPKMTKNAFNKVKTKASKIVVKVDKSLIKNAAAKKKLAGQLKKYGLKVSVNKIKKA